MTFIHYFGSPELPTAHRERPPRETAFFAPDFQAVPATVSVEHVPETGVVVNPVEAYAKKHGMDELLLDPTSIDAYANFLFGLLKED